MIFMAGFMRSGHGRYGSEKHKISFLGKPKIARPSRDCAWKAVQTLERSIPGPK